MIKNITLLLLAVVCFTWISFWANGNCDLVAAENYSQLSNIIQKKYSNIFSQEALQRSLDNLKMYCCKTEYECQNTSKQTDSPQSIVLFDHLLDVYLRRLDAIQASAWQEDLLYSLDPDTTWAERREYITEQWTSIETKNLLSIDSEYKKHWTLSADPKHNIQVWDNEQQYQKSDSEIKQINENFVNRPLINKYQNACEIVTLVYFELWQPNNIQYHSKTYDMKDVYSRCKIIIQQRIQQENKYVSNILQMKGIKSLENNLDSYLSDFFVQSRMRDLSETISSIDNSFFSVYRWVPVLINQCM